MRPVPRQTLQRSPVAVLVPVPLQPGQPRVAGLVCLPNVHHLPRRLILGAEQAARPGVRRTGDGGDHRCGRVGPEMIATRTLSTPNEKGTARSLHTETPRPSGP